MKRAVWSYWTLPHRLRAGWEWCNERSHLLAWVLSVELARRHYPETVLVTDTLGAQLLVERLGLEFSEVILALDALDEHDPIWWMRGKLEAYHLQQRPFIHLDYDVFLWKPLPDRVVCAPVFAQNPEEAATGQDCYEPNLVESVVFSQPDGWIPPEWTWYRSSGQPQRAACCGFVGGNDVEFLRNYAKTAMAVVDKPSNRRALETLENRQKHNPLFEQFVLCACAAYHSVGIEYLFQGWDVARDPRSAAEAGYTHLIANAKSDLVLTHKLERRVARDYPCLYERCLTLTA